MGKAKKVKFNREKYISEKKEASLKKKEEFNRILLSMEDESSYSLSHDGKHLPFGTPISFLGKIWKDLYLGEN